MTNDSENSNLKAVSRLFYVLLLVLVLCLVPVLLIAPSLFPWSDDFTYSAWPRLAVMYDMGVWEFIVRAIHNMTDAYVKWQGTYISCLLMALQPGVYWVPLYHITPVIMLGSFALGLWYFLRNLFVRAIHAEHKVFYCIFLVLYLLIIETIPDPAQAYTWYNGAVHYTYATFLWLVYFGKTFLMVQGAVSDSRSPAESGAAFSWRTQVFVCFMAVVVAGTNNITVLWALVMQASLLLFLFVPFVRQWFSFDITAVMRWGLLLKLAPSTVCLLTGAMVNFLAIGNRKRMGADGNMNGVVMTVLKSFRAGGIRALQWLNPVVVLALVLLVPLLLMVLEKLETHHSYSFPLPGLVTLYAYCLLSAQFAPNIYVGDRFDILRTQNAIYPTYVLLLFFCVFYWLGWMRHRFIQLSFSPRVFAWSERLRRTPGRFLVIVSALLIVCAGAMTVLKPVRFTSMSAVVSLVNGNAARERELMLYNFARLSDREADPVYVRRIDVEASIFHSDEMEDWKTGARLFFDKEAVEYGE